MPDVPLELCVEHAGKGGGVRGLTNAERVTPLLGRELRSHGNLSCVAPECAWT